MHTAITLFVVSKPSRRQNWETYFLMKTIEGYTDISIQIWGNRVFT